MCTLALIQLCVRIKERMRTCEVCSLHALTFSYVQVFVCSQRAERIAYNVVLLTGPRARLKHINSFALLLVKLVLNALSQSLKLAHLVEYKLALTKCQG